MLLTDCDAIAGITKENEETFSDRVLMILQQQKRTKSWLAEEIGISKQALNYILMHSSKKKCIREIAAALEVNPEWLKTGKGMMIVPLKAREDVKFIPVIAMQECLQPCSMSQQSLAVNAGYSVDCFAVILDADSMEPLFTQGSMLIIDPKKQPKNRDFVLFSLPESKQIFFRQFFKEGSDYYFKAMNIMYETLKRQKVFIHGTLVESRHKF